MKAGIHIETLTASTNLCGEGPIWDYRSNHLVWTDAGGRSVFQLLPDDSDKMVQSKVAESVSGIALSDSGGFVFCGPKGLWLSTEDKPLAAIHNGESLFLNDLIADSFGRIYVGSLYWNGNDMEKYGKLYLIHRDGSIVVVDDGIELANGLAISPDKKTLYFSDSAARKIFAYDIDSSLGTLSNKRTLIKVPLEEGVPDGLTVDSQGYLWSAQWYGSQVIRYDPEGSVERRIQFPVSQISSVAFGGKELTDLYVTSAAEEWSGPLVPAGYKSCSPCGGSLYRLRGDIRGLPESQARIAK